MTSIGNIASGVSAQVSKNFDSYANSITKVVETTQNVDLSNMSNIAEAQRDYIQSDVKQQVGIVAQKAANKSQGLVLDLFA